MTIPADSRHKRIPARKPALLVTAWRMDSRRQAACQNWRVTLDPGGKVAVPPGIVMFMGVEPAPAVLVIEAPD